MVNYFAAGFRLPRRKMWLTKCGFHGSMESIAFCRTLRLQPWFFAVCVYLIAWTSCYGCGFMTWGWCNGYGSEFCWYIKKSFSHSPLQYTKTLFPLLISVMTAAYRGTFIAYHFAQFSLLDLSIAVSSWGQAHFLDHVDIGLHHFHKNTFDCTLTNLQFVTSW